ncbi:hypothetical protein GCM10009765_36910 [Fodinicola feengrottensis]|uniref:Phytanoyl-CoA dioxygenase n=2 Tax=Fodinicola feengrottensis TaxID=435914 RepID=A0ABN2H9F6_9ACTN|nr:phytanoyl-CoA dioxygenase family protein [Fodinicola feengrottensis]
MTIDDDVRAVSSTGYERISKSEREQFQEQGWLLIPNALESTMQKRLVRAVDKVYQEEANAGGLRADKSLHLLGFFARDPMFAELLDYPSTFRYVWSLLGWNIYSHHNHIDVNPPITEPVAPFWNWHQDGYRQNSDIDAAVRPMLSLKVCFVLSDLGKGSGATQIIPGSHLNNELAGRPAKPGDPVITPPGAVSIEAKAGDAFIFDRRLWHSRSVNVSSVTRKLVFVGYTHRWIRPLDEERYHPDPHWQRILTPVQQQLLGNGPDHANFWGVRQDGWIDNDIPLRAELRARGLLDGSEPYLR